MKGYYVYDIYQANEIEEWNINAEGCIAGTVRLKSYECLFYCESRTNGGVMFGCEGKKVLDKVFREARESSGYSAVLLFLCSVGANLKERTKALDHYAEVFKKYIDINDRYLTISIITGNCVGGSAYLASLSDFVLFSIFDGNLCITGPKIVESVMGVNYSKKQLGGYDVQAESGVISAGFRTNSECRKYIDYLVCLSENEIIDNRDPVVKLDDNSGVFDNKPYDMFGIIEGIVDEGSLFTLYAEFGKSIITAFARIAGKYIGVLANQPLYGCGAIDCEASEKGTIFLRICSKFNLSLLVIEDVPSFLPGKEQEIKGIQRKGARFLRQMVTLNTKKVTLIVNKSYGGAYIAMNSTNLGADKVYAWPDSKIGIMGSKAERALYDEDVLYLEDQLSAAANLERGSITEIVAPSQTRKKIAEAFK